MGEGLLVDDLLAQASPVAAPRRGAALLTALGLVAVVALGVGGWAGASWLRDRDLRSALAVSAAAVERLVERVEAADGARDLVDVAAALPEARYEVERARTRAGRSQAPRAGAVLAQLEAHGRVLAALEPLPGLGPGPLQAWGQVRGPLQEALDAEVGTRTAVAGLDPDGALGALDGLVPALEDAGGPLLARAADAERDRLRGVLADARTTADLRSAADLARAQRPYVRTTARLAPPDAREAVARCLAALDALSTLTALSGLDAAAWPAARDRLSGLGPEAVGSADAVVARAVQASERWRDGLPDVAAARQAEAEDLAVAARTVRGLASAYPALDAALAALLERLVAGPAGPAELDALAVDADARLRLATALAGTTAPAAVASEQRRLAEAASAEAQAVGALRARLPVAGEKELGGLVLARSAATRARTEALRRWDVVAARATAVLSSRSLPPPPDL